MEELGVQQRSTATLMSNSVVVVVRVHLGAATPFTAVIPRVRDEMR